MCVTVVVLSALPTSTVADVYNLRPGDVRLANLYPSFTTEGVRIGKLSPAAGDSGGDWKLMGFDYRRSRLMVYDAEGPSIPVDTRAIGVPLWFII